MTDEQGAALQLDSLSLQGKWPLIVTALDTSGEKPYEEFVGRGEQIEDSAFESLLCLSHAPGAKDILTLSERLEIWVNDFRESVTKANIVEIVCEGVPDLTHVETGKSLDDRV